MLKMVLSLERTRASPKLSELPSVSRHVVLSAENAVLFPYLASLLYFSPPSYHSDTDPDLSPKSMSSQAM